VAASAAATDVTNERVAKAIVGGLLVVHGIQSRTIGLKVVWGRTPWRYLVSFIFRIFIFMYLFIYLFITILKNLKD
jgi:hypothetical protein